MRFNGSQPLLAIWARTACLILPLMMLGGCTASVDSDLGSSLPPPAAQMTTLDADTSSTTNTAPAVTVTTTENFVRFIHPDEFAVVMVSCMADEGWTVTTTFDGGVKFPQVTEEQAVEMEAAVWLCRREKYPTDPRYRQPLTPEQLTILYDWHVNQTIPCMEAEGFTGFDPPSLESFIENYEQDPWSPYTDVDGQIRQLPEGGWQHIVETCPTVPPIDLLFGD